MAEPIHEQIMQNIDAAILAIDADATGSPYFFTIGANQYQRADAAAIEADQGPFPFIVLASTGGFASDDTTEGGDTLVIQRTEFIVVGFLDTQTNVTRDLARLEHDIRTALWDDTTRGGLAHRTWWEDTEFFYPLNNEGHAQVIVRFFVQFESKLSDLTSTIP